MMDEGVARDVPGAVAALRRVQAFAEVPEQQLRGIVASSAHLQLRAGAVLYRAGEPADSVAVLRSGRLRVVGGEPGGVIGELSTGMLIGELGVLTRSERSATVTAVRDCQLLVVPAAAFEAALATDASLGLAIARSLAARLGRSRDVLPPRPTTSTIGIVALGPDPELRAVSAGIARAAAGRRSAEVLRAPDHGEDPGPLLHAAEERNELTVLTVEDPALEQAWLEFVLRSADRVLVLTRRDPPPPWTADLAGRIDLVLVGDVGGHAVESWRSAACVRARHRVPDAHATSALAAVARRVTGGAVGVVLSGGGARGLAHVGALRALERDGIRPDRLGGTSMGALVAALAATGRSTEAIHHDLAAELVRRNPFNDFTVPRRSVIRGAKAMAMLDRLFGDVEFDALPTPLFVVSADLRSGQEVVHRAGSVRDAVAASMAIPGFAPPVRLGERSLVDGGVIDNLPVEAMLSDGEGPVVAVDVMRRAEHRRPRRLGRGRPRRDEPLIVETLVRASLLGSWERAELSRLRADLVITPEVGHIGLLEFDRLDDAVEAGDRATRDAVRDLPALLDVRSTS